MLNIPNILTLFRIFLIPVFVILFYLPYEWSNQWAAGMFVLAAITDWFDGYLARRKACALCPEGAKPCLPGGRV